MNLPIEIIAVVDSYLPFQYTKGDRIPNPDIHYGNNSEERYRENFVGIQMRSGLGDESLSLTLLEQEWDTKSLAGVCVIRYTGNLHFHLGVLSLPIGYMRLEYWLKSENAFQTTPAPDDVYKELFTWLETWRRLKPTGFQHLQRSLFYFEDFPYDILDLAHGKLVFKFKE